MKKGKQVKLKPQVEANPFSKLLEKMVNSDGYVVLTMVNVEGVFKTKIDYSESMTPEIVDNLLLKVAETIKGRKL